MNSSTSSSGKNRSLSRERKLAGPESPMMTSVSANVSVDASGGCGWGCSHRATSLTCPHGRCRRVGPGRTASRNGDRHGPYRHGLERSPAGRAPGRASRSRAGPGAYLCDCCLRVAPRRPSERVRVTRWARSGRQPATERPPAAAPGSTPSTPRGRSPLLLPADRGPRSGATAAAPGSTGCTPPTQPKSRSTTHGPGLR